MLYRIETLRKSNSRLKRQIRLLKDRNRNLEDQLEHGRKQGREDAHREFAGLMDNELLLHGKELRELHRRLKSVDLSHAIARTTAREAVQDGNMKPKIFKKMFGIRHDDELAADYDATLMAFPQ